MPKNKITKEISRYMAGIGSKGGKKTKGLKARKARENGKLGGRPKKKVVDNPSGLG